MTPSELRWLEKLKGQPFEELSEIEWSLFRNLTRNQLKEERKKYRIQIEKLEKKLVECFKTSGSDPNIMSDKQMAELAVESVRILRNDYDDCCEKLCKIEKTSP